MVDLCVDVTLEDFAKAWRSSGRYAHVSIARL